MGLINSIRSYYTAFGTAGVASIASYRLTGQPKRVLVQMPGVRFPLTIRMRTSDHMVFRDIFQRHEYLFNPPQTPSTIVDAGANVGFASIYFANRWPGARIIALEPDPENFDALEKNARPYPNIVPVQAAVWKESAKLDLFDAGKGSWGLQTRVSADGRVDGLTLPEVMRRYGMQHVDVLKMDIEGAEKEVFEGYDEWIDRVGSLIVEIHDHLRPGAQASVMQAKDHFAEIYDNGIDTWYMLRERTERPELPPTCSGRIMSAVTA